MDQIEQLAWAEELKRLEREIHKCEGDGLRLRWQSGHEMLRLRGGKRLPNGYLCTLEKFFKVHRSDLTARMKFAEKFPTEAEFTNVIGKFRTWYDIKQKALTDTPKPKPKPKPKPTDSERIQSALKDIRCVTHGSQDWTAEDRKSLQEIVKFIRNVTMTQSEHFQCALEDIDCVNDPLTAEDRPVLRQIRELVETLTADDTVAVRECNARTGADLTAPF
jgi:hypothetical protein